MTAVVLFTRDLRVHDHPVLAAACRNHATVVPLFVIDERILAAPTASPNRAAFLVEALADLRSSLRALGGDLMIRRGTASCPGGSARNTLGHCSAVRGDPAGFGRSSAVQCMPRWMLDVLALISAVAAVVSAVAVPIGYLQLRAARARRPAPQPRPPAPQPPGADRAAMGRARPAAGRRPDPAPGPTVEELLLPPAPLRIRKATHLAPLRHALAQIDGAAVFDADGVLTGLGVDRAAAEAWIAAALAKLRL